MQTRLRTKPSCQRTGPGVPKPLLFSSALAAMFMLLTVAATESVPDTRVLAAVDGQEITAAGYGELFRHAVREKYYHRKVPEWELAQFQRQVLGDVIDQLLLLREARRLQLAPNQAAVGMRLKEFEQRYSDQADWPEQRDSALALLEQRFRNEDLLQQLEARTRDIAPPSEMAIRDFYAANPDKFTRPEQVRAAVILLRVAPSAPESDWQAAREKAAELVFRIREGREDFAGLAREYSMHRESAASGGDLGYVHQVMFSEEAQAAVDRLQPGETSDPVMLLEGIGIFRLRDRIAPVPLPYQEARDTARQMVRQQQQDQAWLDLRERLRFGVDIQIHEEYLLPLVPQTRPADAAGGAQAAAPPGA